jgi:mannan endo-1,4-beta-mannosidase
MQNWINFLVITAILSASLFTPQPIQAAQGFKVQGTQLLDANGNVFVMRGVNHPHAWYASQLNTSIAAIAATGANAVRIVLGNGSQWGPNNAAELTTIINVLKAHKLVGVLEVHDCTGYPDGNSVHISSAVSYWNSVKSALIGQEDYIIINIANEPFGNNVTADTYINDHKTAVQQMRNHGFEHTLMVDAANWGQDWANTMLNRAGEILNADIHSNVIFSVHMYDIYDTEQKVSSYLNSFKNNGMALVVGEFAADHGANKPVAAEAILRITQQNGQGILGWSWKGNGTGLESLDITNSWDGSSLTSWGNLLINNTNGIRNTSQIASIYNTPISSSNPISSSPQSSSSQATDPTQNLVEGFNYNRVDMIAPGANASNLGYWFRYIDNYGSTMTPSDSASLVNEFSDGALSVSIQLAPEVATINQYPYAGVGFDFINNGNVLDIAKATVDLSSWQGLRVTYRSSNPVILEMGEARQSEGAEYFCLLPATPVTQTIECLWTDFAQPSWVAGAGLTRIKPLNAITGFKFAYKTGSSSNSFTLEQMNMVGNGSGSFIADAASENPVAGQRINNANDLQFLEINQNQISYRLNPMSPHKVVISDLFGRTLFTTESTDHQGLFSISLKDLNLKPGIYLIKMVGSNFSVNKRLTLY